MIPQIVSAMKYTDIFITQKLNIYYNAGSVVIVLLLRFIL